MAQKVNGRLAYADLLRALALIAILLLQVADSQMGAVAVTSHPWQVFNLYQGLVRWCVPVFVMLSGMFLLDSKHSLPLSKLFFHNLLRVLVCLLFWSGLYAIVDRGDYSLLGLWRAVLSALKGNTHHHFWTLYLIIGLYLMTPILRAFVRGASRADLRYFLLAAFLLASLLPLVFQLWGRAAAPVKVWYDRMHIHLVLGYAGYFVAGYYLKEYTISRLAEALVYVFGIVGAVVTVWGTAVLSARSGMTVDTLYGYTTPNVAAFAVAVVVLFRYVLGVSDERSRKQRLSGVAKISFGIYLVHDFFLMLLRCFHITTLDFAPVASVPLLTAIVFLLSFAVAWVISKLPFLGRWLV